MLLGYRPCDTHSLLQRTHLFTHDGLYMERVNRDACTYWHAQKLVSFSLSLTSTCTHTITLTRPCPVSSTDSRNEFLLCVSQLAPTQGNFSGSTAAINHNAGQHDAITCVANKDALVGGHDHNTAKEELATLLKAEEMDWWWRNERKH